MQHKKIQRPQGVLSAMDGCECVHVGSEPVCEVFQGQTTWQGIVEVFEIIGHPRAKRVYTWGYEDDDKQLRTITVLEVPPVDSAQTAVKAAIAATARGE